MPKAGCLAVFVGLALAGCGDDEAKTVTTTGTPRPALTPYPSVDGAELVAGTTYTTRAFKPALTLTLPDGKWTAFSADKPDHLEIEPETEPPVQDAGLGFHHMTQVFPAEEGGLEPGDAEPGPDDFAKWLTEHPHLRATAPEPVEVMGLKGVSIDVRAKSAQPKQYRDCGKVEGDCVVLFVGGIEPVVYGSNTFGRFLVLEQPDGKQLVIEQWAEPAEAAEPQLERFDETLADALLAG